MTHQPTYEMAIHEAFTLLSADMENPEYDRALVELIHYLFGVDIHKVCKDMSLEYDALYDACERVS